MCFVCFVWGKQGATDERVGKRWGGQRDLTRGRQIKTRDVMTVNCMVFLHDRSLKCQVYPSPVERG